MDDEAHVAVAVAAEEDWQRRDGGPQRVRPGIDGSCLTPRR